MLPWVGVVVLVLWIYCVFDVLFTDESLVRNLPKFPWLLIVLFFPTIGSIAWLVAGRPQGKPFRLGNESATQRYVPRHPPASRAHPSQRPRGPEDSPEFLARLEEERLRNWEAELRRREEELRRREDGGDPTQN